MTSMNVFICLFVVIVAVAGLGINCRGSGMCIFSDFALGKLNDAIQGIDEGRQYTNGQHIACVGRGGANDGFCLFMQYAAPEHTINGGRIKELVAMLMAHGCKGCGSIPIYFPDNNPDNGILTSNYVKDRGDQCDGLC